MTKTGRPSFSIRPDRLKALREQAGLTQMALALQVFGVKKPDKKSDPRTVANIYQRVETTGKTSKQAAREIAKVLALKLGQDPEKTLASLSGGAPEAPPDRVKEIENRLREQHQSGCNPALLLALQKSRQSDQPDEDEVCIEELARRIAFQLETAQLEQRSEELAKLAELTGWTVDKLLRPNSLHGHWLLNTNTLVQRETATRETEILLGVSEVVSKIQKAGTEWFGERAQMDARIELTEDAPWFRVTLSRPNWPFRKEFSFVRCAPSATGLLWTKPTEWDRWTLDSEFGGLLNWAFGEANFVKGFKADEQWPGDLGRLRLWVHQHVNPENEETADGKDWWSVAVHKGYLGEEPDYQSERRDRFREEGHEHELVTNWLASGLWDDVLASLLSPVPADWWEIEAQGLGIQVRTKPLLRLHEKARYALEPRGRTYFIRLMEETDSGELRSAPWRLKDVQALAESLQNSLKACQEQVATGPQRPRWITAA